MSGVFERLLSWPARRRQQKRIEAACAIAAAIIVRQKAEESRKQILLERRRREEGRQIARQISAMADKLREQGARPTVVRLTRDNADKLREAMPLAHRLRFPHLYDGIRIEVVEPIRHEA